MSGSGLDLFGESTRLMVNNMLGKRRGTHIPIAAGAVIVTVVVAAMFMGWGSRREARLALKARQAGGSPMAHVEVALTAADEIWLDGTSLGAARVHELDIPPGSHILTAKQGTRTVTQPLLLKARDNLRVEFQSERVRVLREE